MAGAHANVSNITSFDDVMQGLHLEPSQKKKFSYNAIETPTVSSIGVSGSNLWPVSPMSGVERE